MTHPPTYQALLMKSTELVAGNRAESESSSKSAVAPEVLKEPMQRITALEKDMPKFDTDDLIRIKDEVLGGEFGSMRYRLGIVEAQVQSLGGSIAWSSEETPQTD